MQARVVTLALRIQRFTMARYLLASIIALAVDMALFLAITTIGWPPMVAAFLGYVTGMLVHWSISIRYVFRTGGNGAPRASHAQRVAFFASALLGMGITMAVVGGLTAVGIHAAAAKGVAIGISFLTVYAIRKYGIFGIR
ncbi:GtrA family protein [Sphingobium sp. AN641]|uniref:GtrA family protein n=1 Tax=Sphingobium sp. AN641 TaxID=3133443 RepID=UPI0030C5B53C